MGGVSVDMEAHYESGLGFANATAAISAAMQPSKGANCEDMPPPNIIPPSYKPPQTSSPVVHKTDKETSHLEQSDREDTTTKPDVINKMKIDRGILDLTPVVNKDIQPVRPVTQSQHCLQPVRTTEEISEDDDDDDDDDENAQNSPETLNRSYTIERDEGSTNDVIRTKTPVINRCQPIRSQQVSKLTPKSRFQPVRNTK